MTELFHDLPGQTEQQGRPPRNKPTRNRLFGGVVIVLALALVLGAGLLGYQVFKPMYDDWREPTDYAGPGSGEVTVQVSPGDTGAAVANELVEKNVIKTTQAFISASNANEKSNSLQPGTYRVKEEMKAADALALLLDKSNRVSVRVVLPEGLRANQVFERIGDATGVGADEMSAAVTQPEVGLPAEAGGNPEGYLFPATYEFEPDEKPVSMAKDMVDAYKRAMSQAEVPPAQQRETLIKASIIQAEAGSEEDMPKVARVIENRLATGMPLQMDSTVNFANNKASGITTTDEERANPSPYNTYAHSGLPPGPINSPGLAAIEAAQQPADGDWIYFVTVNPDTGETRFAVSAADHAENVELFRQWLRAQD
jgi:UPF0755 protein